MHDHTEVTLLSSLCGLGLIGMFGFAYFPPDDPIRFQVMTPVLSGIVGGAFSALYRAMGVNGGKPPSQDSNGLGAKLPGT